jgi:UDP-N-acetylglucosamine transferase subunit ALG13
MLRVLQKVVVNDTLMGNHQRELADAMAESGRRENRVPIS